MSPRWVVLPVLFFVFLAALRFGQPVGTDELHWLIAGQDLYRSTAQGVDWSPGQMAVFSPHLYARMLWGAMLIFGEGLLASRILGAALHVGAMIILFKLVCAYSDRRRGFLAVSLYAVVPCLVQGAVICDIDNTLLIPLILWQFWMTDRYLHGEEDSPRGIWVAIAFGLACGGRFTSPLVLLLVQLTMGALDARSRKKIGGLLTWTSAGFAGFFLVHLAYSASLGIDWKGPFEYTFGALLHRTGSDGGFNPRAWAMNVIYTTLWVTVPLICFFLLSGGATVLASLRSRVGDGAVRAVVAGTLLIIGYFVVGGAVFGFPKYHLPGVALLIAGVAIGFPMPERLPWRIALGVAVVGGVISWLVPDLLLLVRHEMRMAQVDGVSLRLFLVRLAGWGVGVGALSLAVFAGPLIARRKELSWTVFAAFAISFAAVQSMLQGVASYSTGYSYGNEGTTAAVEWIREQGVTPEQCILPHDVHYHWTGNRPGDRVDKRPPTGYATWAEYFDATRPELLGISIGTQTVDQVSMFRADGQFLRLMGDRYQRKDIGSYLLFVRKDRSTGRED